MRRSTVEGRRRFVCPNCSYINHENPLPSAAAVVVNEREELLLVKRGVAPGIGKWALPSGFIEIEETPDAACLRELMEETHLRGRAKRLLGAYTQSSRMYKNVLIIAYEVEAQGVPDAGTDVAEARFFPIEKLPPVPFSSHREIIREVAERVRRRSAKRR
jgi:8-oxo-dGTP diphosphatase